MFTLFVENQKSIPLFLSFIIFYVISGKPEVHPIISQYIMFSLFPENRKSIP